MSLPNLLSQLSGYAIELKIGVVATLGAGALLADMSAEAKGWEDVGFKAALGLALIFVVRLLLKQQQDHKAEMRDTWTAHITETNHREDRLHQAMEARTTALDKLVTLTEEQTDYFRTVTRGIVNQHLNRNGRPIGDKLPKDAQPED